MLDADAKGGVGGVLRYGTGGGAGRIVGFELREGFNGIVIRFLRMSVWVGWEGSERKL